MTHALMFLPATELAARIRARELSPVDLTEAMLAAAEASQPRSNAFVTVCFDEALATAREAEAAVTANRPLGPLHGLPLVVKDLVRTAGIRTTYGSRTHADHVPEHDALVVSRLKRAGAIVIGKTTTPEFGHKTLTDAPLTGVTRNPWDSRRTCGGSSGGTAAAIAAGIGPLGLGTDGGGSIRIPAACCGIVGLKPTLGRVAYPEADDTFSNMSHYGPMTRTVGDARLMLAAMAGPDREDASSYRLAPHATMDAPLAARPGDLRVGWLPRVGDHPLEHEVEASALAFTRVLETQGATVETLELDVVAEEDTFVTILRSGLWARSRGLLASRRALISDSFARSIELGEAVTARHLHDALMRRSALFRRVQRVLERVDVVVSPALTAPAIDVTQGHFDPVTIAGETHASLRTGWHPYAFFANLTGHPAISVPSGWSHEGLPLAVQVLGPYGGEALLLDIAERWEQHQPWAERRPPTL